MAADLRVSRDHSADDGVPSVVPALASFISEAALPQAPAKSEPSEHPLWQFPEERRAASRKRSAIRQSVIYISLAAAIVVATIAGVWWGGSLPSSRSLVTETIPQVVVVPPAVTPPADAPELPPADLTSSVTVQPSIRPPVASVVLANPLPNPVALSASGTEPRQPQERTNVLRGTSGGTSVASIPRPVPMPPAEPIPAAPLAPANLAVRSPAPEPPPQLEASAVLPPPASRVPPALRPEPEALPSVVARTEQSEIQRALGQYRSAYQLLDAEAAREVWPSVDVRALARAFDSLTSQQLAFDTCLFEIAGDAATAQCRGSATYTPKVGNRAPKLESRQWTFQLRKLDEGWKIQSAQARR